MNIIQISEMFPTELSCVEYAEQLRWNGSVKCAYCHSENVSERNSDMRRKCRSCLKTSSVTVNTSIHNTKLPLKIWLFAVSIITDAKKGISALQLQRNLNVSYPTAFSMYHKIREIMQRGNKDFPALDGIVEMDETYIGGKPRPQSDYTIAPERHEMLDSAISRLRGEGFDFTPRGKNGSRIHQKGKRGRGTCNIPVVGIVQRNGNVVAEVMETLTYENLRDMVRRNVNTKNSLLITDSLSSYDRMQEIIRHIRIDHSRMYSYRGVNSNSIESFWAIIERGIMGQYHSVSPGKLPNYIAEFVYKYNNRKDNDFMFEDLLRRMIASQPGSPDAR